MLDTLPYPFNDEIKGIAHAANVPLGMFIIIITIFFIIIIDLFVFLLCSLQSFQSAADTPPLFWPM